MSYTITNIFNKTGSTSGGIEGQDSLDGDKHGRHVESLKHDLCHLFTVSLWVQGSFSQESGRFFRGNTKFIIEGMVPNFLHVIPVSDNAIFNWIFESHDTSFAL